MSERPDWWTSDEWSTPVQVFNQINHAFGPFDLDPCCRQETALAESFYTTSDDGLAKPWFGRVWVNPPYSNPRVWIERAIAAVRTEDVRRVVMLLPGATDTTWFHDLVLPNADVVFVRGRVKFIGWEGTPIGSPKSGSIIAVFPKQASTIALRAEVRP